MRSAWSPARSRSLDTLLEVLANRALASPTVFASDLASTLAMFFGTGIPSTVFRRPRAFSAIPPAIPAAAAPTAMAGPFALSATCLTEPTMPLPFWLPLLLARAGVDERLDAVLRLDRPLADVDLARPLGRVVFARAFDDDDFARPLEEADRFVAPDPFDARAALAGFARLFAALDRLAAALVLFAVEPFELLSATGSSFP